MSQHRGTPAESLPRSGVHEVFCGVEALRQAGMDVLSLHIAEPTARPEPAVLEAMARALGEPFTYTSVHGLPAFNAALREKLEERNGIAAEPDWIFVCPGATQGMLAIERLLAYPGAQILLPSLHWPLHLQQALLAGFVPRFYDLGADFLPDPAAVAAAVTPWTRALFLNSPHNPTGAVYGRARLEALLEIARRHDLAVISDEAYEDFVYDGEHVSPAALERDLPPAERRVFSVFSFSKSHGLGTGRLGYVVAPNARAARALNVVQEVSIMAPTTLLQFAGEAAVRSAAGPARLRRAIRGNRDRVLKPLLGSGLLHTLPSGGWYTLLDLAGQDLPADRFAADLLECAGVAIVPAASFALRPRVDASGAVVAAPADPLTRRMARIAYSGPEAELAEGIRRIIEFMGVVGPSRNAAASAAHAVPAALAAPRLVAAVAGGAATGGRNP
jgi:aspartate aminotransferase